jgi:crotonobetainyl-CoA:carnitine CoA-transferase CaiB-like acyl-CoA transferase
VLAALRHRDRTGAGQYLDVSLLDCGIASLSHYAENYLVSGEVPLRRGNGGFGGIPSQAFTCADDRMVFIVATTNPQFARATAAMGRPELIEDPRFCSIATRIEHRLELLEVLEQIFAGRPAQHWLDVLDAADVPISPVNDISEALADPQVQHRGLQVSMPHPAFGELPTLRYPIRMSETPVERYDAPPELGADTDDVLRSLLGLSAQDVAELRAGDVI